MIAAASFVAGVAAGSGGGQPDPSPTAAEEPVPELPRGGTELLPAQRLVGFYGAPQDPALGALGIGSPVRAAGRLTVSWEDTGSSAYDLYRGPIAAFAAGEFVTFSAAESHRSVSPGTRRATVPSSTASVSKPAYPKCDVVFPSPREASAQPT